MWVVHPIISEELDRTTSEDIANFLNQAETEGLKLVAMDQGFFFFKAVDLPEGSELADDLEDEVVYEEEQPPPEVVHSVPTRRRRAPASVTGPANARGRRPSQPDPSIRPTGTDLDPNLFAQPGQVRVDPRVLHPTVDVRTQPVAPNAQPHSDADPFGLS